MFHVSEKKILKLFQGFALKGAFGMYRFKPHTNPRLKQYFHKM